MSILNIISVFWNDTLLAHNNTFSTILFEKIILPIIATTNIKDLFGSFGIVLFSDSKNGFRPFFIPILVINIHIEITTKLIPIIEYLYLIFVQKFWTYCSPNSRHSKYSPLNVKYVHIKYIAINAITNIFFILFNFFFSIYFLNSS